MNFRKGRAAQLLFALFLTEIILSGCGDPYPENPYSPDNSDEVAGAWEDVLAADSNYPSNVYLTENIEFNPGKVGPARISDAYPYYDSEGYPKDYTKNGACGPPEGSAAIMSSAGDMTVLGSGGSAVWMFDPDWVIVDGDGDDFVTFSNHNVFGGEPDGSWNELAHVYISEDNINWYKSSKESYTPHPDPGNVCDTYDWDVVEDLHGNNHSWANFRTDVEAEELNSAGVYEPVTDGSGAVVSVSKYFKPTDPYLGGDRFDLADFIHTENGLSWPSDGKMRYLKLVDDPSILDGQDYNPVWMTGARIMSAMGINVEAAE